MHIAQELAKVGLAHRAMELFDWLRSLEQGHDLSSLTDVYTYTTIISQCGSHHQLRKALELVAEMRSRVRAGRAAPPESVCLSVRPSVQPPVLPPGWCVCVRSLRSVGLASPPQNHTRQNHTRQNRSQHLPLL
jgi:pentatricopeptide repeat protein